MNETCDGKNGSKEETELANDDGLKNWKPNQMKLSEVTEGFPLEMDGKELRTVFDVTATIVPFVVAESKAAGANDNSFQRRQSLQGNKSSVSEATVIDFEVCEGREVGTERERMNSVEGPFLCHHGFGGTVNGAPIKIRGNWIIVLPQTLI